MGLKTVLMAGKLTSTKHIHETLHVMPLEIRRNMHVANEMAKVCLAISPLAIQNMFFKVSHDGPVTRSKTAGTYDVPKCNLEMSKRNFRYRGPVVWTQLPTTVCNQADLDHFKKANTRHWMGIFPNGIT